MLRGFYGTHYKHPSPPVDTITIAQEVEEQKLDDVTPPDSFKPDHLPESCQNLPPGIPKVKDNFEAVKKRKLSATTAATIKKDGEGLRPHHGGHSSRQTLKRKICIRGHNVGNGIMPNIKHVLNSKLDYDGRIFVARSLEAFDKTGITVNFQPNAMNNLRKSVHFELDGVPLHKSFHMEWCIPGTSSGGNYRCLIVASGFDVTKPKQMDKWRRTLPHSCPKLQTLFDKNFRQVFINCLIRALLEILPDHLHSNIPSSFDGANSKANAHKENKHGTDSENARSRQPVTMYVPGEYMERLEKELECRLTEAAADGEPALQGFRNFKFVINGKKFKDIVHQEDGNFEELHTRIHRHVNPRFLSSIYLLVGKKLQSPAYRMATKQGRHSPSDHDG